MVIFDAFCGAGGAAMGYYEAGWSVVGVDIEPQPRYPFPFIQGDAVEALMRLAKGLSWKGLTLSSFHAFHASPPCQAYSDLQKRSGLDYPDLVPEVQEVLRRMRGKPYVIENVPEAPLRDPIVLCGTMFPELRVLRHRAFESNVALTAPPHPGKHPLVFTFDKRKTHYGKLDQDTAYVQVTGGGNCTIENARDAMGIDWMTKAEINEAIPPAYTRYIGEQLLDSLAPTRYAALAT